jgi:hypothetical protein
MGKFENKLSSMKPHEVVTVGMPNARGVGKKVVQEMKSDHSIGHNMRVVSNSR